MAKTNRAPTFSQAGYYSATLTYLNAVKAAGATDPDKVMAELHKAKIDDIFTARVKDAVSGLEVVSMGEPYKESGNQWVMIPYEVEWKGGGSQTNSLRMMKYPNGQWIWGGGF